MIEPASAELLAAADRVEAEFPRAAEWLRAIASPAEVPDPRAVRRLVLRQLWRKHYHGVARTTAARLLAAAWSAWEPGESGLPGTLGEGFARLGRLGAGRPLAWRQIADDLDAELDQPDCKLLQVECNAARDGRW